MKKKKYPLWFEESFDSLRSIDEEIHRMMKNMTRFPLSFSFKFPTMKLPREFARNIPIHMAESDGELLIRAELPGFKKDEIKLKVTPTTLDISAEKKKISIDKGKNFFKQEKSFGSARRVMTLPFEVKTEGSRAKFENGILEIILQKAAKKKEEKELKVQ